MQLVINICNHFKIKKISKAKVKLSYSSKMTLGMLSIIHNNLFKLYKKNIYFKSIKRNYCR